VARIISQSTELKQTLMPQSPGRYEVLVRGLNDQGLAGRWSPPLAVTLIGVALPEGAYVSTTGAINMSVGQEARFTHADGLELTYSGAKRFVPADSPVPLHGGERTMVSFRMPGSLDLAIAKLQPRNVWAEVEVGPKTATWPNDRLTATVRLKSYNGEAPPSFIQAKPRVTVGVDPVEVTWKEAGGVLTGSIPTGTGKGPWVVRVEVEDQFGWPLGRDFVEVIESTKAAKAPIRSAAR
jgi:hypothetical protein